MQVQIEFWQLIGGIVAVIAAFGSMTWAFGSVLGKQFKSWLEERFETQDEMRLQREKALDERFKSQEDLRQQREKALDERFAGLQKLIRQEGDGWREVERQLYELKASLPLNYVLREDDIRKEVVLNHKLDALAQKIDALSAGRK